MTVASAVFSLFYFLASLGASLPVNMPPRKKQKASPGVGVLAPLQDSPQGSNAIVPIAPLNNSIAAMVKQDAPQGSNAIVPIAPLSNIIAPYDSSQDANAIIATPIAPFVDLTTLEMPQGDLVQANNPYDVVPTSSHQVKDAHLIWSFTEIFLPPTEDRTILVFFFAYPLLEKKNKKEQ